MTHNELLNTIDTLEWRHKACNKLGDALRAVVELHKPRQTSMQIICCEMCSGKIFVAYPCLTIQAIEKELRG